MAVDEVTTVPVAAAVCPEADDEWLEALPPQAVSSAAKTSDNAVRGVAIANRATRTPDFNSTNQS